ncbi:MAG TPA: ADP-ribosylglycohydrolase family protein, partial [Herpetosiphonaceae bacterium]
ERAQELAGAGAAEAAALLGNGGQVAAWDTVPFALWCAGGWLGRYEEAIWQALAGLGDTDTVGAIVGGIVALSGGAGIPAAWLAAREPLPADLPAA